MWLLVEAVFILVYYLVSHFKPKVYYFIGENEMLKAAVSFVIFVAIVDVARNIISILYSKRRGLPDGYMNNFHYGIINICRVIIGIGFIFTILRFLGIDIHNLLTSLSIVAAAIAIISREYIGDFLIGIYLSFSKDLEIDDYVKIGEQKGKIIEIQMLKTKLLNDDDDIVLLPNSKIYNNEIINYTRRDIRQMSVEFEMYIHLVTNLEQLESELTQALIDFHEYIEPNSYNLKIVHMAKDSMDLKFQYTLRKLDREMIRQIRKKTVRQVFNHISSKNLEAPNLRIE